jgi:hypothetical protein
MPLGHCNGVRSKESMMSSKTELQIVKGSIISGSIHKYKIIKL